MDTARQKKVNGLNNVIYDGFNSKKQYKYVQYNKLIKKMEKGKKFYDPTEIVRDDTYKYKK